MVKSVFTGKVIDINKKDTDKTADGIITDLEEIKKDVGQIERSIRRKKRSDITNIVNESVKGLIKGIVDK